MRSHMLFQLFAAPVCVVGDLGIRCSCYYFPGEGVSNPLVCRRQLGLLYFSSSWKFGEFDVGHRLVGWWMLFLISPPPLPGSCKTYLMRSNNWYLAAASSSSCSLLLTYMRPFAAWFHFICSRHIHLELINVCAAGLGIHMVATSTPSPDTRE